MKKIFIYSILAVVFSFAVLTPVMALNLGGELLKNTATQAGYDPATGNTTLSANIGSFIKIALSFVGVIFLALMVYAGFLWLTARGESEPVEKAGKIIKTAVIGFIITVGAYSITNFVVPAILERTTGVEQTAPLDTDAKPVYCCYYCVGSQTLGMCNGKNMKEQVVSEASCLSLCKVGTYQGCKVGTEFGSQCTTVPAEVK